MLTKFKPGRNWRTGIKIATAGVIGGTLLMPSVSPATHVIRAAQDVFVANTPSNPVPTKATGVEGVRVENGADRPVPVAGAVDANIQGTPTVRVVEAQDTPITREVRFDPSSDVVLGFSQIEFDESYVVPAGKLLTIRHVSLQFRGKSDANPWWFHFYIKDNGGKQIALFPFDRTQQERSLNEQVTIFATAGQRVRISGGHDGQSTDRWIMTGAWTGTLTDVDSGAGSTG